MCSQTKQVENNTDEHDSDDNSQCNSENNDVKKNQELSVSDAEKSEEVHSENETF